jgi:hypothetical protein
VANLGLFAKNLEKISDCTIVRFGCVSAVSDFLEAVAGCGNIYKGADCVSISPLSIQRLINDDRYLAKCVAMARQVAVERAESVLYERAINGYEEITYGRDGEPVQVKRKYCAKSLMEYLKANSGKYCGKTGASLVKDTESEQTGDIDISKIEIESYANYC